jgi:ribonuclease D
MKNDRPSSRRGRKYASKHNLTLNSLVGELLERTVEKDSQNWLQECFHLMDQVTPPRVTKKWKREDLHRG